MSFAGEFSKIKQEQNSLFWHSIRYNAQITAHSISLLALVFLYVVLPQLRTLALFSNLLKRTRVKIAAPTYFTYL